MITYSRARSPTNVSPPPSAPASPSPGISAKSTKTATPEWFAPLAQCLTSVSKNTGAQVTQWLDSPRGAPEPPARYPHKPLPPYNKLDLEIQQRFLSLDQKGRFQAEYVWIGGHHELRCKTRTLDEAPKDVSDLPIWNYDGSSTDQAPGQDSEVLLRPCAMFSDPFRPGGDNLLVMCDCYLPDPSKPNGLGEPIPTNTRSSCNKIMELVKAKQPWFGIEQEYTLFEPDQKTPYGWPVDGFPGAQGPYYCSVGVENAFGRAVCEAHYKACMYAGVKISGINGEVMPGQWEYQVGPCEGIDSGDHLMMSRYLLIRVCEQFGVVVSFDPKPIPGDWNGAGCHTNVSTNEMRAAGGYDVIMKAMSRLGAPGKQEEHIQAYDISGGKDNARRLTGAHETAPITEFTYGVANRGCSVRIPRMTEKEKKGYFEDRRPASNMDPYVVTSKIMETCVVPDCAKDMMSPPRKGVSSPPNPAFST